MKTINYQFKMLSAIAILAVVSGHSYNDGGIPLFFHWFTEYSFHLPLFVFISGYFYKDRIVNRNFMKEVVWRKFKQLFVPLFFWNLVYGIFCQLISVKGFFPDAQLNLKSFFYLPFVSQHQFVFNCPAWFITPLFMCYVIYPLIRMIVNRFGKIGDIVFQLISIMIFIAAFEINKMPVQWQHPDMRVFVSRFALLFPFFHFGYFFKQYLEKILVKCKMLYVMLLCSGVEWIMIFLTQDHDLDYGICWAADFQDLNSIVAYVSGVNAILFFYALTSVLVKIVPAKFYMKIADHTYDIMMHHLTGFFLLNTFIAVLSKARGFAFDWNAYKTNIYYQYDPFYEFSIIYLIGGFSFAMLIALGSEKVIKWYKSRRNYYSKKNGRSVCKR